MVVAKKVKAYLFSRFSKVQQQRAAMVCNYTNNYYGDQMCSLMPVSGERRSAR